MVIMKGEKEYTATETKSGWKVTRTVGGVKVSYTVPKEAAPDAAALKAYIAENNELF